MTWGALIPNEAPVEGPNERCIEIPLAREFMQLTLPGRVLDAGCALNGHLQADMVARVCHLTQNIASEQIHGHDTAPVSYLSADLRDLSLFAGAAFDRTVCISTLEHVGLDNSGYLGEKEAKPETVVKAFKELCRVTRSALLITVPYAEPPHHCSKWRYFGSVLVGHMVALLKNYGFQQIDLAFYAKTDGGWYGGNPQPVKASLEGFPGSVNAIVCIRCYQ